MALPALFSKAVRGAAEAVTMAEVADNAVTLFGQAIGASGFLFGPDQAVRASQIHGELAPLVAPYLAGYAANDLNGVAKEQHPHPILIHSHAVDDAAYRRSATYQEFFRRYDVEYFISVRLFDAPASTGPITLLFARGRHNQDFDAQDARLLLHALPVLNAAVARAARYEALLGERRVLETMLERADPRAQVAVDETGRILWLSARAEALLIGRFGRRDLLPGDLIAAARRLARFAKTGGSTEPLRHHLDLAPHDRSGHTAPLHARLSIARTAMGSPFVEIDLEAAPPSDLATQYRLTAAEMRVLELLGQGLKNAQIAARLFVSVETVKTHVRRVLDKLGVQTRAQAALLANGLTPPRDSSVD